MKLVLTTTYSNVDGQWLDWWLRNNSSNYGIDLTSVKPVFPHRISSKDPASHVWANTKIELKEEENIEEVD